MSDLAHVLRRWQEGGIRVLEATPASRDHPRGITVRRPPWFRAVFHAWLAQIGFRRSSAGGFGAWVALPSESTGSGGFGYGGMG